MPTELIVAIVAMTAAMVFYSVAVWSEQIAGVLQPWHLTLFWLGLACDTTGTTLMSRIAGAFRFDLHGVAGLAAIVLMLVHAIWATVVLARKQEEARARFHRFSVHVWALWMVPFVSGIVMVALAGR